jgi:hypothetical protein
MTTLGTFTITDAPLAWYISPPLPNGEYVINGEKYAIAEALWPGRYNIVPIPPAPPLASGVYEVSSSTSPLTPKGISTMETASTAAPKLKALGCTDQQVSDLTDCAAKVGTGFNWANLIAVFTALAANAPAIAAFVTSIIAIFGGGATPTPAALKALAPKP